MAARLILSEMTREQIRDVAPTTTVILPTSAIEQHGPHLPIRVDTEICEAVCRRAAELASARVSVTVAPTVHFGSSHHHIPFPGVLTLSSGTFHRVLCEITESLARSGFKHILIINGHGGNDDLIRQAARDTVLQYDVTIAAASYWTIARAAMMDEVGAAELGPFPGHAGAYETSCLMALRPDLVSPTTKPPRRDQSLAVYGPLAGNLSLHRHASMQRADGYSDDARDASPERGERYLAIIVREVAETIVKFSGS